MLIRDERGAAVFGGVLLHELLASLERAEAGASARLATPAYVYDLDAIVAEARALAGAFGSAPHLIAYAVKANTAGPIVRALAACGLGAEVVSGSELEVALACGVHPDRILYSGVAKMDDELDRAISAGDRGILAVQMESVEEIARVDARGKALGRRARASIRVNPSVEADTHAHVATGHDEAKFGVAKDDLPAAWDALARASNIDLVGLSTHIGSQLTRTGEYEDAARELLAVASAREAATGTKLTFVDFGGGYGIDYGAGCPASPADFARAVANLVAASQLAGRAIVVEPGRSLVAAHGALCARVIMRKRSRFPGGERRFLLIDAGMNDLIRPALYGARHRIEPVASAPPGAGPGESGALLWRVAGPVCESSDDFGEHLFHEHELPTHVVIRDAGAYGFTMASEYNGRALPTEIFLSGGRVAAINCPRSASAWAAERASIGQGAP
jgi:diaminopimelate decarboxylase